MSSRLIRATARTAVGVRPGPGLAPRTGAEWLGPRTVVMLSWAPRWSGAGVLGVVGGQPPRQRAAHRDRPTATEQQEPGAAASVRPPRSSGEALRSPP